MDLYVFVQGPLLWISFSVFILGSLFRIIRFFYLAGKRDRAFYQYFRLKYVLLTLGRWLLPLNKDVLKNPVFTLAGYIFHICLFAVPIWLAGHISLWEESRLGWSWTPLPGCWADFLTLVFLAIAFFFFMRRILKPEIRLISSGGDYLLLAATIMPFLTGIFLAHNTLDGIPFLGEHILLLHMLSAEFLLVLIPFSRLSHFMLFFFSRSATAVEFGRRGYSV
jgi:nitrate reductase gamma subunit